MKLGKKVYFLNTKNGKFSISYNENDNIVIIEDSNGNTHIHTKEEYEKYIKRIERINKLLK